MREYRTGEVADLLGVSVDTVRRWADDGRLATTRGRGGHRVIAGPDLAEFLSETPPAFEPEGITRQSARNRFTGVVVRVERDGLTGIVELRSGAHRVVSLVTADALDDLRIEPGDLAVASVKATNVVIELPPG